MVLIGVGAGWLLYLPKTVVKWTQARESGGGRGLAMEPSSDPQPETFPGTLTWEEIWTSYPQGPKDWSLTVNATLYIAQQDGRCGFAFTAPLVNVAAQTLSRNPYEPAVFPNPEVRMYFSDRARFTGTGDEIGLKATGRAGGGVDLAVRLWSWGGIEYSVPLELPSNGTKLYVGWGQTIGGGEGEALHTLSFNDFVMNPPPEIN